MLYVIVVEPTSSCSIIIFLNETEFFIYQNQRIGTTDCLKFYPTMKQYSLFQS